MDRPRPENRSAKATRASLIAEKLRQSILRGDLAPGSKVNLETLREQYSVSLSPMREAISRLVNVGLVEFEDQRGYRIAPVSLENLNEVTRLRATLESLAIGYSVESAGLDWESEVLGALHRLNRTERNSTDPLALEAWEAAHSAFHLALIAGCGMPMLIDFCRTLHNLSDRYRRLFINGNSAEDNEAVEHSAIAHAAASRRDRAEAESLLRAHIEQTGRALAECLENSAPRKT